MFYQHNLEKGEQFEDFVSEELLKIGIVITNYKSRHYQYNRGENPQGIEIKLDSRCTDTGRLSIEVAEASDVSTVSYIPSGIYRNDNSWLYIQGNYSKIWIFAKSVLKIWERSQVNLEYQSKFGTLKTFYLSCNTADKIAGKTLTF